MTVRASGADVPGAMYPLHCLDMMSFNWQTEETADWQEPPLPEPEKQPQRRPWFWRLLLLFLLLAGSAVGLYWGLTQRVEQATEASESDLMTSYRVLEGAAREGDSELFNTLLSGRDQAWAQLWAQQVMQGEYQNREAFGLMWLPSEPATAVITTTLNPEFNAAEVRAAELYSFQVGRGLTETVTLWQTAVFRLGSSRWLLSPPDAAFWGETLTKSGFYLTLRYPERDQAIAERLALDLDSALAALCANAAFNCPEGFHLQVEFSTNPASLSPQHDAMAFVNEDWLLRLPTPTLAGLPQDEAGYRTLARGYAGQLLVPVMAQRYSSTDATREPFQAAWFAWQLDRLAIRPYPLLPADRQNLAEQATALREGEQLWAAGAPATPFAYALTEFLIQHLGLPPKTIMDALVGSEAGTYEEWLLAATENRFTFAELEVQWQAYLRESASRYS